MTASPPRGTSPAAPAGGVRPLAPVFLSYRTSDGAGIAADLAWALRATGVPVWHDVTDLPPGDTERRLQEALTAGLSGAVLLVTPDIRHSRVVREIEVPRLLDLEPDPAFTFAIGSTIPEPAPGGSPGARSLDYAVPDTLLAQPAGTLRRFKQYPVFDAEGIAALARAIAAQRMAAVRALGSGDVLLDIHTRLDPRATTSEVPLAVRTRPPSPGQRLPNPGIWPPVAAFLADLPRLLSVAGAQRLHIRGRAHLTVAFALGAAVPTTSAWPVTVEDEKGRTWGEPARQPYNQHITLREDAEAGEPGTAPGAPVAVYVDLVPSPPPVDAFAAHLAALEPPGFGGDSILPRCSGLGGLLSGWPVVWVACCLPRYRRLTEPRVIIFPLLFIEHLSSCAVLMSHVIGRRRHATPPGRGRYLLVGQPPGLRRGFPGQVKGDAQRHRLRRRRRP
jgi:TIR domain